MKEVFTTGQIARICKVASRTVTKWFDSGKLKGYRIPGSQDRRIPREDLLLFLKDHGMPTKAVEDLGSYNVLLVGVSQVFLSSTPPPGKMKFQVAGTPFEAGLMLTDPFPDGVVVDLSVGESSALAIAKTLQEMRGFEFTIAVALTGEDDQDGGRFVAAGYNEVFQHPCDPELVCHRLLSLIQRRGEDGFRRGQKKVLLPSSRGGTTTYHRRTETASGSPN